MECLPLVENHWCKLSSRTTGVDSVVPRDPLFQHFQAMIIYAMETCVEHLVGCPDFRQPPPLTQLGKPPLNLSPPPPGLIFLNLKTGCGVPYAVFVLFGSERLNVFIVSLSLSVLVNFA